jgi:hypothetical protein
LEEKAMDLLTNTKKGAKYNNTSEISQINYLTTKFLILEIYLLKII